MYVSDFSLDDRLAKCAIKELFWGLDGKMSKSKGKWWIGRARKRFWRGRGENVFAFYGAVRTGRTMESAGTYWNKEILDRIWKIAILQTTHYKLLTHSTRDFEIKQLKK